MSPVERLLKELRSLGQVESRSLVAAKLIYAEPERKCAPAIELVLTDADEVTYVAIADVVELEFSDRSSDQHQALELLEYAVDGGMAELRKGTHRWILVGDMGQQDAHIRVVRTWCAWRESPLLPGRSRSIRV